MGIMDKIKSREINFTKQETKEETANTEVSTIVQRNLDTSRFT